MFIKILPLFLAFGLFIGNGIAPEEFDYIGSAKCKSCHSSPAKGAQYKKWAEGPHANAMKSLKGDELKDPKCLKCHSTAGHVDEDYIATLTEKEGVGCESCHGAGSDYKSMSVMKSREKSVAKGLILPDAKLCETCHNDESPTFKGFDYDEYWKKIDHSKPSN